jgi:hypothetical protein
VFLKEHQKYMEGDRDTSNHHKHRHHHRRTSSSAGRHGEKQEKQVKEPERTIETSKELFHGQNDEEEALSSAAGNANNTQALGMLARLDQNVLTGGADKSTHGNTETLEDFGSATIDVDAPPPIDDNVLPVPETVTPPPKLLERLYSLEAAQAQVPKATPPDIGEVSKKLRKQRCLVGASVVIVAVIVAIVLGVVLGTKNDDATESF